MKTSLILAVIIVIGAVVFYYYGRPIWVPVKQELTGRQTVVSVLNYYGEEARRRLMPHFKKAGINYPPEDITLIGLKDSATLELWAETKQGPVFIRSYDIQALSGVAGPKLREGDKQVPEGIYKLEYLNPNSSFHLSMKINYPNAFDLKYARKEGRAQPGSDIFIHGKAVSIGCLAMGDENIEELFVLVADIGKDRVKVLIAPTDPRVAALSTEQEPGWVGDLYGQLNQAFEAYR